MNHKFYSVNVSNSGNKKQENSISSSFILEKELKEIYDTQYNDIFPKILSKTKSEYISLLKEQVYLHLHIINKKVENSLNSKYLEKFTKRYFLDKSRATKGLEELIKNPDLKEKYLDLSNCYIHCHKCSIILHKCKNRVILYKNFIYCLHCQKVYNESQVKLYCQECKSGYYTKLRYIVNKKYENFYPVSFKQYHCTLEEPEKIKCLECGHDLYYNITYEKTNIKKNTIKEVFCLKCKLLYDLNEIFFKCKICKSDFKSEAQLYTSFSPLKVQFLLIMHSLRKKIFAVPDNNLNRKCKCNIEKYEKYLHQNDNGVLYLGHNLEDQYVIICDGCYTIFKYNDFLWHCPVCSINYKSKKISSRINQDKTSIGFGKKISEKIENKKQVIFKSPSHLNINRKKIEINQPISAGISNLNSNNIAKHIIKRNNTKIDLNDKEYHNKSNNITKVILLTNKYNSEKKIDNNLSGKKEYLFKKIKKVHYNINISHYNSLNSNNKESGFRKSIFKMKNSKNSNTVNSLLNNISFSNNKSESNTNNCTKSTSNVTYKNNGVVSDKKNECNCYNICKCSCCSLENEYNKKLSMDNKRINRKLVYDDFIEKDKGENLVNTNETKDNEKNEYKRKSKTCLELGKSESKKDIKNVNIKLCESGDNLIKNQEIKKQIEIDKNKKEKRIYKTDKKPKQNLKYIISSKKIEKGEEKKINISICNYIKEDKNNINLDKINSVKNLQIEFNSNQNNNNNIIMNNSSQNKIKNIKSVKQINSRINNLKKINNNVPQNKIKCIKSVKYINTDIYKSDNIKNDNNNMNNKSQIKVKEIAKNILNEKIEKKPISNQPSKKNSKNKNINKNKSKKQTNSIFEKIKKYYEDYINEEEDLFKNDPKNINKQKISEINTPEKKIEFKKDFNSENYFILKLLGRGTYGKTYLVEEPKSKERFALKKININDKIELKENQDEYNLILKLTKEFPDLKIINIYGIEIKNLDKYSTVMYVLMEAANCDWEKEIVNRAENNAFYKESELMEILTELIKTFAILQKNGISHRDVKPQNILCFGEKGYKISDFGEAKNLKKNLTKKNFKNKYVYEDNTMKQTLRGTELYMSPILFQALRSHPYQSVKYNSYKSDVFSLGMCFFLASSLDYEGLYEVREILKNPKKTKFVVNRYLNMRYSQKYINLLISMLQINEKDRPDFIELEKIIEKIEI